MIIGGWGWGGGGGKGEFQYPPARFLAKVYRARMRHTFRSRYLTFLPVIVFLYY